MGSDRRALEGPGHTGEPADPVTVQEIMRRDVAVVGPDDRLSDVHHLMSWRGLRHVPVVEGRALLGIVSERDVLRARLEASDLHEEPRHTVGDVMSGPAQLAHPRTELATAAAMMTVHGVGCLPVVDAGRVVGLVTMSDVLGRIAQSDLGHRNLTTPSRWSHVLVGAHADRRVGVVQAEDRLVQAATQMIERGTRCLAVLDPMGRVVGILSERDLRAAVGDPRRVLDERESPTVAAKPVAHAMQRGLPVLVEDDSIDRAFEIMVDGRFAALPVTDSRGAPTGILSYVDLVRGAFNGRQ